MGTLETFAKRFRELREESGLKQVEIGDKLGVSRGAISFYENGDRTPDIDFAAKAANFFGVTSDYILGLSDIKKPDASLQAAVGYTGLEESSAETLHALPCSEKEIVNWLLSDEDSRKALRRIAELKQVIDREYNACRKLTEQGLLTEYARHHFENGFAISDILLARAYRIEKDFADILDRVVYSDTAFGFDEQLKNLAPSKRD